MMPRCYEIDELLAPFVLDALDTEERLVVLEHLSACRLHDEELSTYREVAGLLPHALDERQAPPAMRRGLLSAFDAAVAGSTAGVAPAAVAPSTRPATATQLSRPTRGPAGLPRERNVAGLLRMPALGYGLAAALLVVVLGLAVWNLSLQGDDRQLLARASSDTRGGMDLRVYYLEEEGVAVLKLELPPLSEGRVYQAWQLVDGRPLSLGVVPGSGVTAFPAELDQASAIAISVEPPGGSLLPTTDPILFAKL